MRIVRVSLLLVLAAIALAVAASWPSAVGNAQTPGNAQSGGATLSVAPPSGSVTKSSKAVQVAINVANVKGMAGFQFILGVDAKILKPTGALKTAFLGSTGRQVYCPDPTIEPEAIRYVCVTLGGTPAAVDGSGTVANVSFNTVGNGQTDLTLTQVKLVAIDGSEIPSTSTNSRISVTGGSFWTAMHIAFVGGGAAIVLIIVLALLLFRRARVSAVATPTSDPEPGT